MQNTIFSCEYCDFTTKRKYNLQRHQIALHISEMSNPDNEKKDIQYKKTENKAILCKETEDKAIQTEEHKEPIETEETDEHKETEETDEKDMKLINECFNCTKCGKIYKTKKSFINHEKNCIGINSLTCCKCMKEFSSYGNKSKHIKKNNCTARSISYLSNNYINNFGDERTDFITFNDMCNIMKLNKNEILPHYIELKYFNKNFPENHNIKFEKNNNCLIKKNDKWRITNIENLSINLIDKNSFEIRNYFYNNKNKLNNSISDIIFKKINYLSLCLDKNLYSNIKNEIKVIIRSTTI